MDIPEDLKVKISDLQKKIDLKGVKPTKPENLHWTVKFLGEISDVNSVISALGEIKYEPFDIELVGVGAFPSESYVRVIWVGVGDGEKEFEDFLNKTKEALGNIGKKDNYETKPHLTIGRVKFIKEDLKKKIQDFKDVKIGKMTVDKLVLYKSQLTQAGPVYTKIKEFGLF